MGPFRLLGFFAIGVLIRIQPLAAQAYPPLPSNLQLDTNPSGGASNLNTVFEPGETVTVRPVWVNPNFTDLSFSTQATNFVGAAGAVYTIVDSTASYYIPAQNIAICSDCFVLSIDNPTVRPEAHWDVSFTEAFQPVSRNWNLHVGASFVDVPTSNLFYFVSEIAIHKGITAGCGGGQFCPTRPVTRAQAAVLLLKAEHSGAYTPPECTGIFNDVPCAGPFAAWIEQLSVEGVTAGCGGGNFCPDQPVTRAQMAVLLSKTRNGASHVPVPCTGRFTDVPCSSPFADWIEELATSGVTAGCGPHIFCPGAAVLRGQAAAFLVKEFAVHF